MQLKLISFTAFITAQMKASPKLTFEANLNLLLSSLISNASLHDVFYTTNLAREPLRLSSLFPCRGYITAAVCQDFISAAAKEIIHRCPNQTESVIWYDVCMSRYSNASFNIIMPCKGLSDPKNINIADQDRSDRVLASLSNKLAAEATLRRPERRNLPLGRNNLRRHKSSMA